jgi:hypothetical protein
LPSRKWINPNVEVSSWAAHTRFDHSQDLESCPANTPQQTDWYDLALIEVLAEADHLKAQGFAAASRQLLMHAACRPPTSSPGQSGTPHKIQRLVSVRPANLTLHARPLAPRATVPLRVHAPQIAQCRVPAGNPSGSRPSEPHSSIDGGSESLQSHSDRSREAGGFDSRHSCHVRRSRRRTRPAGGDAQ